MPCSEENEMNATTSTDPETLARAKDAKAGDRLQRGALRIEVTSHCDGIVNWTHWDHRNRRSDYHTPIEEWHRLVENTLLNGAVFTPAA